MNELFTEFDFIPESMPIDFKKVKKAMKEADEMIILDRDLIPKIELEVKTPTKKELRLAIEIINDFYPLYRKADLESKVALIRDIFKFDVSVNKISKIKPFKKLLYKTVLSVKNHNGKTIVKHIKVRKNNVIRN